MALPMKHLSLLFSAVAMVSGQDIMPVFLFAGQSNMEGVSEQSGKGYESATGKPGLSLNSLVPILTSRRANEQMRDELIAELLKVNEKARVDTVAQVQADALLDMKSRFPNLSSNIQSPLPKVYCSWTRPEKLPRTTTSLDVAENLSPTAECGLPWGPELVFGHTLSTYKEFAIAKVASGGTAIYDYWTHVPGTENGNCWDAMQSRIQNLKTVHPICGKASIGGDMCKWQGLVYFQGENDCFHEDNALGYSGNLTNLIANTRQEMFDAGVDHSYTNPDDIPVVIVQLGCWASTLPYGAMIMSAQAEFVDKTPNTALVTTFDLSCFYHMDAAAHLIVGDRIARAMESLL